MLILLGISCAVQTIAKHVMNIHMNRATDPAAVGEIDIETMKRYISYCKAYVPPAF